MDASAKINLSTPGNGERARIPVPSSEKPVARRVSGLLTLPAAKASVRLVKGGPTVAALSRDRMYRPLKSGTPQLAILRRNVQ